MFERLIFIAALAVPIHGCGAGSYARLVRSEATGGQVELRGDYDSAMPYARALMAEHCSGRFELIGEHGHASVPDRGSETVEFTCQRSVR